jgi:hypothetical protein
MRRIATILVLLALAAAVLAGLGSAGTTQTARLRLVTTSPLTVAGTGFQSRERTRVNATSEFATETVRVIATRTGTFRVTFAELAAGRCDLVRVVATGRAGSTVVLKRLPAPACILERVPETIP